MEHGIKINLLKNEKTFLIKKEKFLVYFKQKSILIFFFCLFFFKLILQKTNFKF